MRSKRVDLDEVAGEFETWRASREERRIPESLWSAAVGLLDRHAPSAICRRLRLSPQRFKEVCAAREGGTRAAAAAEGVRRAVAGGSRPGRETAMAVRPRALPSVRGFLEMAPMMLAPTDPAPGSPGCRVVLETAGGTVTVVAAAAPAAALLEAAIRMAVGLLGPRA